MSIARSAPLGLAVLILSLLPASSPGQASSQPAKAQPVDFHKLQELMPEQAVGVPRSNVDGENMDIGQWTMSRARADYMKPDSDGSDHRRVATEHWRALVRTRVASEAAKTRRKRAGLSTTSGIDGMIGGT